MNAVENQVRELVDVELAAANDTMHSQKNTASIILEEAIHTACEAIQVAAMAQKYLNMEEAK